jgi:hypothetical protein
MPKTQSIVGGESYRARVLRDTPAAYYRLDDLEGYAQAVLSDAPTGYWRLNGNGNDAAASPHNATVVGGVTFGQASPLSDGSTAALFDGSTGYASVANGAYQAFGTGPMSAECWFKVSANALAYYAVDNKNGSSTGLTGFSLLLSAGQPSLRIGIAGAPGQTSFVQSATSYADGQWHHMVGVLTRGATDVLTLYVDGVLNATANVAAAGWNLTPSVPLWIARRNDGVGAFFAGVIQEIAIYNYALSAQQIANHYALRTSTITSVAAATVVDASGNGHTGTITGGVTLQQTSTLADGNAAALFDGASSKIALGSLLVDTTASVEAWIKTTIASQQPIFSNRTNATTVGDVFVGVNAGKFIVFTDESGALLSTTAVVNDNNWHHVVWTHDGTTTRLYVDGLIDKTVAQIRSPKTGACFIGFDPQTGNEWWPGALDEVALYGYALTAEQVAAHYGMRLAVSSGLRASGAATPHCKRTVVASGGVRAGGAATIRRGRVVLPSGGVRVSGAGSAASTFAVHPRAAARVVDVAAESRVVAIPSELRGLVIPFDNRVIAVPAEAA